MLHCCLTRETMKTAKVAKVIIVSILLFFLWNYVNGAWSKFSKGAVGSNTRQVERSRFDFPAITLCLTLQNNATPPDDGFWAKHASHYVFVNDTHHAPIDVSPMANGTNSLFGVPNSHLWEQHTEYFWAVDTYCNTYFPVKDYQSPFLGLGYVVYMTMRIEDPEHTLMMMLSHPKLLQTRSLFGASLALLSPPSGSYGKSFVFDLRFTESIGLSVNTDKEDSRELNATCTDAIYSEDESYATMEECFRTSVRKKHPCYTNEVNMSCGPEVQLESIKYQQVAEKEFVKMTGCPFPCTIHGYEINLVNTMEFPLTSPDQPNIGAYIYIGKAAVEINEEYLVYDRESLFADISGIMGMLLGISFLSMYECILGFLKPFWKAFIGQSKRKLKKPDKTTKEKRYKTFSNAA